MYRKSKICKNPAQKTDFKKSVSPAEKSLVKSSTPGGLKRTMQAPSGVRKIFFKIFKAHQQSDSGISANL
jgi:hypothetical protein